MEPEAKVTSLKQRVFFALLPDDGVRVALSQAAIRMQKSLRGRRIRDENIHLTLAFLGDVDAGQLARLKAVPATVISGAFLLVLDRLGCWPHNAIGWASASNVPGRLLELSRNLEAWLRIEGLDLQSRPFKPHVTLLRDAECVPMQMPLSPIIWKVADLALVRSQLLPGGSRYEVVARWRLPRVEERDRPPFA